MAKGIEVIERENKELASNVLRDALIEDPMFQYMFKDPNRSSLTKMFFNYIIYKSYSMKEYLIGIRNGQTLTSVAIVETPCSIKGKQIFKRFGFILKSIIFLMKLPKTSTKFILQYMKITTNARPKSNHHYLVCIGVDPMHQKKGYAREMLNHIHEIVDKDPYSTGIGLDTENLVNVEIYKKFGYELVSETPIGEITIYCMFRKKKKC